MQPLDMDIGKIDPHNSKARYMRMKNSLSTTALDKPESVDSLLSDFLADMEEGRNTSGLSKRGPRSHIRLLSAYRRLSSLFRLMRQQGIEDVRKATEEDVSHLFTAIETGKIRKSDGSVYKSGRDFLRDFKVFWKWYRKTSKQEGKIIPDICSEIGLQAKKPGFVHITLDDLQNKLLPHFTEDEQTMLLFIFDTIIRSPTELQNIHVFDLYHDCRQLKIRDSVSKTYGRTIPIHLCSERLQKHIIKNNLKPEDRLFNFSYSYLSWKLQQKAFKVFGDAATKGGEPYKNLSLYDFRHSGAIHWRLTLYKNNIDALMYRGGWSNLEMLNYYTRVIGMTDLSQQEAAQAKLRQSDPAILDMMRQQETKIDSIMKWLQNLPSSAFSNNPF